MMNRATALLTVRCSDKGKLVGHVHEQPDGSQIFVARRAQVATPDGWFDQANLRDEERTVPSGDGEISVDLSDRSTFANASFAVSCGCRQRVLIIPSQLRKEIINGHAEVRLEHQHD